MKRAPESAPLPSGGLRSDPRRRDRQSSSSGCQKGGVGKGFSDGGFRVLQAIMGAERAEEALADAQARAGSTWSIRPLAPLVRPCRLKRPGRR